MARALAPEAREVQGMNLASAAYPTTSGQESQVAELNRERTGGQQAQLLNRNGFFNGVPLPAGANLNNPDTAAAASEAYGGFNPMTASDLQNQGRTAQATWGGVIPPAAQTDINTAKIGSGAYRSQSVAQLPYYPAASGQEKQSSRCNTLKETNLVLNRQCQRRVSNETSAAVEWANVHWN